MQVDRLAFWNEEFAGISGFELSYSTDNSVFTSLGNFTVTNNPGAKGPAGAAQPAHSSCVSAVSACIR